MCRSKAYGGRRCPVSHTRARGTAAPACTDGQPDRLSATAPAAGSTPPDGPDPDAPAATSPDQPSTGQVGAEQGWPPPSSRTEMFGKPMSEAERRSLGLREAGYQGWINQGGYPCDADGVRLSQAETGEWIATGRRGGWHTQAASVSGQPAQDASTTTPDPGEQASPAGQPGPVPPTEPAGPAAGPAPLPTVTRARLLATPVRDLTRINPDGSIDVVAQPKACSEATYRDHLASADRITLRVREADTADLPERLWGGARYAGLDPVSAQVMAESYLRKGWIVTATWTEPRPGHEGR